MEQKEQTTKSFAAQMFGGFFGVFYAITGLVFLYALVAVLTDNADAFGLVSGNGKGYGVLIAILCLWAFVAAVIFFNKEQRRSRGLEPFKLPFKW